MSGLLFESAAHIARAIRERTISAYEVTSAVLDAIARCDPAIKALCTVDADRALVQAKDADRALERGESGRALRGVPITVKDNLMVAGVRTTAGMASLRDYVPSESATAVARLTQAGAIVIGKSNVPERAADWQTSNAVFGTTVNPWDPACTPGGSSGGGAAAVAAGMSYLDIGSDFGGSLRIPASFCGVYAHRPSVGLVPQTGQLPPLPGAPRRPNATFGTRGPIARSPLDLLLALQLIGGPDGDEARAYRWELPPARSDDPRTLRLGFVTDDAFCRLASDVAAVVADAVRGLRGEGFALTEGWPVGIRPSEQLGVFRFLATARRTPRLRGEELRAARDRARSRDGSWEAFEAQVWTAPLWRYRAAEAACLEARAAWQAYFGSFDAFLMPVVFSAAFPHDLAPRRDERVVITVDGPRAYRDLPAWCAFASVAGLPATAIPIGRTAQGLPVGLQIVGPYLEDATPIGLAVTIAEVLGGYIPPP